MNMKTEQEIAAMLEDRAFEALAAKVDFLPSL